jgi:hypothetical protein
MKGSIGPHGPERLSEHATKLFDRNSAAVAALSDNKLRQTNIAAAVGCGDWFGSDFREVTYALKGISFASSQALASSSKHSR